MSVPETIPEERESAACPDCGKELIKGMCKECYEKYEEETRIANEEWQFNNPKEFV